MVELNFSTTNIELSEEDEKSEKLPLMIHGLAVKSGLVKSKNFYLLEDELSNIVDSLKTGIDGEGAYLLKNHGVQTITGTDKNTDSLIGKVTDATKSGKKVNYKARVEDADIANKLRKRLVSSSSIGLSVAKLFCSICGREYASPECNHKLGQDYPEEGLTPDFQQLEGEIGSKAVIVGKGVTGKEISIVLYPAVEGANAIPFSFDEHTEKFIELTERGKVEQFEPQNNQTEINESLEKVGKNAAIQLDDVMQFCKGNGYIVLKVEDLKNLRDTVSFLETSLWCRDNGIEFSTQYLGLDNSQKEMILELSKSFAQSRSMNQGRCAQGEHNMISEEEKSKEDFRELIFHKRRDAKEILDARKRRSDVT